MSIETGSIRVVYVGTYPPHMGGSAVSSGLLLRGMAAKGHRIHVITSTPEDGVESDASKGLSSDMTFERFRMPYAQTNPQKPASPTFRERQRNQVNGLLRDAIARKRPEVVLIGRETFLDGVPEIAQATQIPSVVFSRGLLKFITNDMYPDLAHGKEVLEECKEADLLVPVAHHLADDLHALGFSNLRVLTNGVDVDHFKPGPGDPGLRDRLAIPAHARIVLHASNFKPIKRIEDLVVAAKEIVATDPAVYFVIVGDDNDRKNIEALCSRLGLSDHFRFPGWVPQADLPDYFNLADVFVLPSESEVAPRVALEAMACGRAIVISEIAAAREIFADGSDGVLYPLGDASALARVITELLDDPGRRERLGRAARRKVEQKYDIRTVVDRFEAMAYQVIADCRRQADPIASAL